MALCIVCQEVDVRSLLLRSLEAKEEGKPHLNPGLGTGAKYHGSISSLRAGADSGCPLCGLIWRHETEYATKTMTTDDQLQQLWKGELFLGTDGWTEPRKPTLEVYSKPPGSEDMTIHPLCELDVFARKGEYCVP